MSKFCSYCGAALNERDNFCPNCGKEILATNTSFTSPPPATSLWKKIFTTKGRLNRWVYFKYSVGIALFLGILAIIIFVPIGLMSSRTHEKYQSLIGILGILLALLFIIAIIVQFMLAVRRLHDLNLSGLWYLAYILLIGIGNITDNIGAKGNNSGLLMFSVVCNLSVTIASLFLIFKRGTVGYNKYGADPLEGQR